MFYYLNGMVAETGANLAVIDCGGVGYACATTNYTLAQLKRGEKAKLYTYLHVKEDALTLYGFADEQEKQFFLLLISISGVGPKGALSVLSEMLPDVFAAAVMTGDYRQISKANGVGPKLAQRICLELKDKLAKINVPVSETQVVAAAADKAAFEDAAAILASFGYHKNDVAKALEKCTADNSQDLVRQALRLLSNV